MRKIIIAFVMMICAACVASGPNYLAFTAEEDGSTFGLVNVENNPDVQYSLDDGATWIALEGGKMVTLAHKGDKALLKGNNPQGFSISKRDKYSFFTLTGKVAASGSVMSLIDGVGLSTEIPGEYCFSRLFENCASLTQAPELPAKKMAKGCCEFMFSGCTGLTQAPALPATTLAEACYSGMFSNCASLTQTPALSATTLAEDCYFGMFSDCTSLTQAPELPSTTLADNCYRDMFYGCTSLTRTPELPAMTLAEACYSGMFSNCTSLTQAPALLATTLAKACYAFMFSGCASLTQAPKLPATTLSDNCYRGMFYGCTSLSEINVSFDVWSDVFTDDWAVCVAPAGTFICPKGLPLEYGLNKIPKGWKAKYR